MVRTCSTYGRRKIIQISDEQDSDGTKEKRKCKEELACWSNEGKSWTGVWPVNSYPECEKNWQKSEAHYLGSNPTHMCRLTI